MTRAFPLSPELRRLIPVGVLLALSGCLLPKAQVDPTRYYVLSASAARMQPAADAPALYLRQIDMADYLRARPLVVRQDEHEIEFREYARWGEALDLGIGRVLRQELIARGAAGSVLAPGLRSAREEYDFNLKVRVLACEGAADGTVLFRAAWELTGSDPGTTVFGDYRPTQLAWDGESEASLVRELSRAVVGLADEIAAALARR